jgi:hypothetical protein
MLVTFLVAEARVGTHVVFVFLGLLDLVLMLQDIGMEIVEGSTCGLASMVTCSLQSLGWTKCPLLLLFLFYSLQVFGPNLFFSCGVEAVVRWLVTPVVHHIDKLH